MLKASNSLSNFFCKDISQKNDEMDTQKTSHASTNCKLELIKKNCKLELLFFLFSLSGRVNLMSTCFPTKTKSSTSIKFSESNQILMVKKTSSFFFLFFFFFFFWNTKQTCQTCSEKMSMLLSRIYALRTRIRK